MNTCTCIRLGVVWCERRPESAYWIGLRNMAATEWYDGNTSPYRPWASGEPNSAAECIRYTSSGFRDTECDQSLRFICKKGAGSSLFAYLVLLLHTSRYLQGEPRKQGHHSWMFAPSAYGVVSCTIIACYFCMQHAAIIGMSAIIVARCTQKK